MRIGRLDVGFSRKPKTKKIKWEWGFSFDKGICGCVILSIGPLYITWLSSGPSGCYSYSVFHLKRKAKKPKKGKQK
jgi:hypothetical protein